MATLMQAVERVRGLGKLPTSGEVKVSDLQRRFPPSPPGCLRALLARMFGEASIKAPWAVILCRFKGEGGNPLVERPVEQFYRGAFSPGTGGLVEYWRDVSLGMIDINGSQVFGWLEIDITRANAAWLRGKGVQRRDLIDAAVRAAQSKRLDPVNGFHSQIAVYMENWSTVVPPGTTDWSDPTSGHLWIDMGADRLAWGSRVCLTPPHDGNICAHEMGHSFDMYHDLGPDLVTDYADPCCILSQNNAFVHPTWERAFGPALCLPHLVQKDWMFTRRVYYDGGAWQSLTDGIALPLAPITDPGARANLGIKLAFKRDEKAWDYYLEWVKPTDWNQGIRRSLVFIRRIAPWGTRETPAFLGSVEVPSSLGVTAEFVEPSGNVRFQVERFDTAGRILSVRAKRL